jgi:4-hydroxy-tetrahydrodipicolinate synthase
MFKGSYTALITPFKKENINEVDYDAFEKLIERQIFYGTHGLVPCGTTGESPTLTEAEHDKVIEFCIKIAKKRVKVLAGTGSNCTREAIERTIHAQNAGSDGALIMTPYYNKPTQEGIFRHFEAIHNATNIPIIIYNIPGRSVVDIKDETIARIAKLERVVGVKDATGNLERPKALSKLLPKDKVFYQLSGDDETAIEFNKLGGVGCISVTSNIDPETCAKMQEASLKGDFVTADKLNSKVQDFHKLLFLETSPSPVKYCSEKLGLCYGGLRLPLVEPTLETKNILDKAILDWKNAK